MASPTLTSFASGTTLTNAGQVTYVVTFSEAVTGVTAADFSLDPSDTDTAASIAGVTELGTSNSYSVTVNTGGAGQNGTIKLDLNGATITDVAGDPYIGAVFQTQATYPAGSEPLSVIAADLNNDGHPDLVVADYNGGGVDVLLNNGSGGFGAATSYATGSGVGFATTGDINGDGRPDIVAANSNDNTVSVLLNNGNGTFGAATSYAAGNSPYVVAVADLNGDGHPDLVVADGGDFYNDGAGGGVDVLLNNGSGGFRAATSYAAGSEPEYVAVADVNGDGHPDLVVADQNGGVDVLLGNGDGTFRAATSYAAGIDPYVVAVADVNGDGHPDIIVADSGDPSNNGAGGGVDVLLGNGSGGFGTATSYAAGSDPESVAVADVNGDGHPDLVVADQNGGVDVLLGNGSGGFGAATSYAAGSLPYYAATADLNGDGRPDIVVANSYSNNVSVLLNATVASPVVTVDTIAPAISSITLGKSAYGLNSTVAATIQLSGTYDGHGAYTLVPGSTIDGATLTGVTYNSGTNTITGSFTVSSGTTEVIAGNVATHVIVADAAGNVSAPDTTAIANTTIDTHAPTAVLVAGFTDTNPTLEAGKAPAAAYSPVGALGTTDASPNDSFTYALGGADAGRFGLSGSTLEVGGTALTDGMQYNLTITATDLGGNSYAQAVQVLGYTVPSVVSIDRANAQAVTNASSDPFTVTFSQAVTGVTAANFTLSGSDGTGTIGTPVSSNGGLTWTVPVTGVSGNGTLGLGLTSTTGIVSTTTATALGATHPSDQFYTIDTTPPVLTISPVTADNIVNKAEAQAGVTISGTTNANGQPVSVMLSGSSYLTLTTVAANGAWAVALTPVLATALVDGVETVTASVQDAAGNRATVAGAFTVDETAPTLGTETVASPSGTDIGAGKVVTFTLATSEMVTATGSALTLSDGASAAYASGNGVGTSPLTYTYTVAANDTNTKDLQATGLTGTIKDGAGNLLSDASFTAIDTKVQVDTVAPTITVESATPKNALVTAGTPITFTITTSEAVNASSSSLTVTDNGLASYVSGSGSNVLTYTYTAVQDDASDIQATALTGTITDGAGNMLNTAAFTPIDSGVRVPPVVNNESASPTGSDLGTGQVVAFTVGTSPALTATGSALTLSNGATAAYVSGASTGTLTYAYTVAANDGNTKDLQVTGFTGAIIDAAGDALTGFHPFDTADQIDTVAPTLGTESFASASGTDIDAGKVVTFTLQASEPVTTSNSALTLSNGATAAYASGSGTGALTYKYTVQAGDRNTTDLQATGLTGAIKDGAGNLLSDASFMAIDTKVQVDTVAPTLQIIIEPLPANPDLGIGKSISVTLGLSEAVSATGSALTLSNGGKAVYTSGSGTNNLTYTYTVAAGDNSTSDLRVTGVAGTIADGAGNAFNYASFDTGLQVDTTVPTLGAESSLSPSGTDIDAGKTVTFTLATSEPVTVTEGGAAPTLQLDDGEVATYTGMVGAPVSALTFSTTVKAGDTAADLEATALKPLPSGTTIQDKANNTLVTSAFTAIDTGVRVDTTAPTITSVAANPGTGALKAGQAISFTLATSEPVSVAGTPTLTLNDGGTAIYSASQSTETSLVFTTLVAAGQNVTALAVTGLSLTNGATILDAAGNAAVPGGAAKTFPGLVVEGTPPTLTSFAPSTTLTNAGMVTYVATFSAPVTGVTASDFTLGGTDTAASLGAVVPLGNGASYGIIVNTGGAGHNGTIALDLTGATIEDAAGNGYSGGAVAAPIVTLDTMAPTLGAESVASPRGSDVGAGATLTFAIATSEPVIVVNGGGGLPILQLSDGEIATYTGATGTAVTSLAFSTIVRTGDNDPDLTATALALPTGTTIRDAAGNDASLSSFAPIATGVAVDTTPPTLTSFASGTTLTNAGTVTYTATFSEAVTGVSAADFALDPSDTDTAASIGAVTPVAGSDGASYTVIVNTGGAGHNGTVALDLTGGTIEDLAGNGYSGGAFQPQATYGAGQQINSLAAADLTGDGRPDLILADQSGGVDVLTNNGSGGFGTPSFYAVGSDPISVTTADVNGDGRPDIVVADNDGGVDVLLNNGSGGFDTPVSYAAGVNPMSVTTADLNGDGHPDIVVADSDGGVDVLLNNGSGSFGHAATYAAGLYPISVTTADVNGDGHPDLVVADFGGGVDVLLNNGSGSFGTAKSYSAGAAPAFVTSADLNGDGRPDLVVADLGGGADINGGIDVLLNNGLGGFGAPVSYAAGANPASVTVADVNGDGHPDLVVADSNGGVDVLLGDGSGGFGAPISYAAGSAPGFVTTADLDGDGRPDIVAANLGDNTVTVLRNAPSPVVGRPVTLDTTAPTITADAATPATGNDKAGQAISFTLTTSEPVSVTGTPVLTLNDGGGTASYDAALSTATSLVFTTTVMPGQNAAALAVTGVTLPVGAAIQDAAGNAAVLGGAAASFPGLVVDTIAPTITGDAASLPAGSYKAGQAISFALATSEPVRVTGTPVLTLNDGGTASYDAALSTATSLVFTTTIAAGQNAAALAVTGVTLPGGAAIQDAAGNAAVLGGAATTFPGLVVDTIAPTITGDATSPGTGAFEAGEAISFTLTTSEPVSVTGTPVLTLNDDGGTASYDAALSTATSLMFTTTIAAGQNAAALAVTGVTLPGGAAIQDAAGNAAVLGGAAATFPGLVVDTTAPTITGDAASLPAGSYKAGQAISFTLATSEPVSVTGTPVLTLNDGGGTASYDAALSTATSLVFTTTIAAGQNAAGLAVTGVTLPGGAAIQDAAGNAAVLGGAATSFPGLVVDTIAPTITADAASLPAGSYKAGQAISFTLATSEPVSVTGTPVLTLNDGGTASYNAALSTATNLVFTTTVMPGQNAAALAVTGVTLPVGAAIQDAAGNAAVLGGAAASFPGLVVDTTAPTITGDAASLPAGSYKAGQAISFTLATSEPVSVTGTPVLTLNDGGGTASYDAALSTATSLVFTTTIAAGQNAAALAVTGLTLPVGAAIKDAAGNAAVLDGAATTFSGLVVDTIAPTITGDAASLPAGSYKAGQAISFALTTSEPVSVTGTPVLTLNDDGGTASYDAALSTATNLVFTTTVMPGQNAAALAVTGVTLPVGAAIQDAAGNAAVLGGAAAFFPGLVVDTIAPTITAQGISGPGVAADGSGDLDAGHTVTVIVTTSEPVTVSGGTPMLTLNDGGTATYSGGSGTTQLTFSTVVATGQNTPALAVTALDSNGAALTDGAGNPLDTGSLATAVRPTGALEIDTAPPAVASASLSVAANTDAAAIGLGAPSDSGTADPSRLAIIVATLPGDGTVTLADGTTLVSAGETLTASELTGLAFTPTAGSADVGSTFGYAVTDPAGNVATGTATLAIAAAAPTLAGAAASQQAVAGTPVALFSGITVSDINAGATDTLTIAPSGGGGVLSGAGTASNGIYTLSGTAAQVTSQLDAMTFTPAAGQPGTNGTTTFALADTTTAGTTATATTAVTAATPPAVTIAAPAAGSTVSILDPIVSGTADAGDTVTLTSAGQVIGTAIVAPDGSWSDRLTFAGDGSYAVTASDTDAAGLTGMVTDTFTLDSTPNEPLFGAVTTDVTSAGGQVYALYQTILGRAPDPTGFESNVAALAAGASLSDLAQGLIGSGEYASDYGSSVSSNQGFVDQLYQDGLHRAPDPSGEATWVGGLDDGTLTRTQVAVDIATSAESQQDLAPTFAQGVFVPDASDAAAARLYYGLLGRTPDAGGLQANENAEAHGVPVTTLAQNILLSPEYQGTAGGIAIGQYVTGLYETALGRAPDPVGFQTWTASLETGANNYAGVADGILTSSEFQTDEAGQSNSAYVDAVYVAALGRHAEPGGLQNWDNALASGQSRDQVAREIVASQEFASNIQAPQQASFVSAIYEGVYGRAASAGELSSAQSALNGGMTPATVAVGVIESNAAAVQLAPKIEAGFHVA